MQLNENEILDGFGKLLISKVRDRSIDEALLTLRGEAKDVISISMYDNLKSILPDHLDSITDIVIDTVDAALNNFLWMIEEEDIDIVSNENKTVYSLKNISDGLSVDYWNFVDQFSKHKRLA